MARGSWQGNVSVACVPSDASNVKTYQLIIAGPILDLGWLLDYRDFSKEADHFSF
jgi:hypothetical protein